MPDQAAIIVAGCNSLSESRAVANWILPVLQEWPKSAWKVWLTDATDCEDIRAALIEDTVENASWKDVDHASETPGDTVCQVVGGRTGLVIFAPETITNAAARSLEGLVSGLASFAVSDPLAKPFKKSFASFGVFAGI
jgi:hypothetical protein